MSGKGFFSTPSTKLGWWAVWFAVASVVLFAVNMLFVAMNGMPEALRPYAPFWFVILFLPALAGGVLAIIALTAKRERSWMVWLVLLPLFNTLFLLAGELLLPLVFPSLRH